MLLSDMHVMFRQFAQQMGMQNVRAILPEQIDLLINTSISDTVNQTIREHLGVTNDRIITDNSKIGQINALRTLFKTVILTGQTLTNAANYGNFKELSIDLNSSTEVTEDIGGVSTKLQTLLYLSDLSIFYSKTEGGKTKKTNLYPIRIIDDTYLADTLNDFVLSPRFRTPVAVVSFGNKATKSTSETTNIKIYTSIPTELNDYNANVRISYIKEPAKVHYIEDVTTGGNTECDLPSWMHVDIVKHAVDLYRISVQGSLMGAQAQQQAQQQEMVRNNARPQNEGYQQSGVQQ